ncbi:MAG: hypothetical protein WBG66_17925 [Geitlerinemataceae cyanobacterium]
MGQSPGILDLQKGHNPMVLLIHLYDNLVYDHRLCSEERTCAQNRVLG